MILKIKEEEMFCWSFWFDIDLDFKIVFESVVNINLELLILFKNFMCCIDRLL